MEISELPKPGKANTKNRALLSKIAALCFSFYSGTLGISG